MSYFKKARKYTEPSVSLDEKIAKANQEYEKTGVELSEWSGNKTSGVYYAGTENPEIPAEQSEVPDTTGWRDRDPSLPAENASDIDPNDSSTWQTGGMGMDDLINPNSLPVDNGDDVSNQPTVATPDLSGFKSLRTDANDPNSEMASYGGIARTSLLGVWGTTTGVIGNGNKFESVLLAFGWPTGPLVDSHEPGYPSDRSWGGIYRYDDNATYGARLNMRSYMNNLPEGTWKAYKCWVPFNSYGFGQTWTEFSSNPNNIWKHDGNQTLAYVQVSVYAGPGKYNSSQTVPPSTTVLFKDDLGKAENLPNGGKLKELLEKLFGIGGSAADELAGGLPYGTPGADDPFDAWDDDLSDDDLKDDSDFNPSEWDWAGTGGQGDDVAFWGGNNKPQGPPTAKTHAGALDATKASTGMYDNMTPEKFKEKYGMSYDEYMNLPQAGQSQSSAGGDGNNVASSQTSPFPSDPASDASSGLGVKDGDQLAFNWGNSGTPSTNKKLGHGADTNAVNYANTNGEMGGLPDGWTDQDLKDYLDNRDKGFPDQSSIDSGLPNQMVAALNSASMPQHVKDSIKRQYKGGPDYSIEDKKNILNWQQKMKVDAGGSDWTPSSELGQVASAGGLGGLFGSSGSGSGSTGQLNLPSWFSGYGNARNAKLDAEGRIYGYNYSGGYGYLSRGPGSGAPGTAESGYGTKGFDWDTQSGGTSWSFTRHDPSKVAASPNSPDPVKPGDVPTAPSSPYLPGKSPYKVAANKNVKKKNKVLSADYKQLENELLSEDKLRILKEIKKPVVLIEASPKMTKLKGYRPNFKGKFTPQNTPNVTACKESDGLVDKANARGQTWRTENRYWQGYETTERMNIVYDRMGHGQQAWDAIIEDARQKNGWKNREIQEQLNQIAHEKAMRKIDPDFESPWTLKEMEDPNKDEIDKYMKDPLVRRVRKRILTQIDYPDKPSKKGYPDEPPKPQVDGWHPEFGKKTAYYKKLDPVSALAMPKQDDPQIDAEVEKQKIDAIKQKQGNLVDPKVSKKKRSNWQEDLNYPLTNA